jgi:DNA-binding transcriptional LysR family regulator
VRLGLPPGKSFVAHELASPMRILCASQDYLAARPAPSQPADLGTHDCLCYRRDYEPVIWVFEDEVERRQEIEVGGPLRANSGDVLRHAALDGLGMALLPEWMVGQDVAAGRLVRCLERLRAYAAGYQAPIYAVHARTDFVPAKITAFVAHLQTRLGHAARELS